MNVPGFTGEFALPIYGLDISMVNALTNVSHGSIFMALRNQSEGSIRCCCPNGLCAGPISCPFDCDTSCICTDDYVLAHCRCGRPRGEENLASIAFGQSFLSSV